MKSEGKWIWKASPYYHNPDKIGYKIVEIVQKSNSDFYLAKRCQHCEHSTNFLYANSAELDETTNCHFMLILKKKQSAYPTI